MAMQSQPKLPAPSMPKPLAKSQLNSLAAGGKPLKDATQTNVAMPRTRMPSLSVPKAQLITSQGGSASSAGIRPPTSGSVTKAAAEREDVEGYTRVVAGKVQLVTPHSRRGDEKKPKRPVYEATTESRKRAQADIDLWTQWRTENNPKEKRKLLGQLLKRLEPLMKRHRNQFYGVVEQSAMTEEALMGEYEKLTVQALLKFDPSRGTQINTYLMHAYEAIKRFVLTRQNVARIPETVGYDIGRVRRARDHLTDFLGREPLDEEVAKSAGVKLNTVVRLSKELRQGRVQSEYEKDPTVVRPSEIVQTVEMLDRVKELSSKERALLELLEEAEKGQLGEAAIKPRVLAKKMGVSGPEFSNIKKSLTDKVLGHLGRKE